MQGLQVRHTCTNATSRQWLVVVQVYMASQCTVHQLLATKQMNTLCPCTCAGVHNCRCVQLQAFSHGPTLQMTSTNTYVASAGPKKDVGSSTSAVKLTAGPAARLPILQQGNARHKLSRRHLPLRQYSDTASVFAAASAAVSTIQSAVRHPAHKATVTDCRCLCSLLASAACMATICTCAGAYLGTRQASHFAAALNPCITPQVAAT